jgi:hypothetical protein
MTHLARTQGLAGLGMSQAAGALAGDPYGNGWVARRLP